MNLNDIVEQTKMGYKQKNLEQAWTELSEAYYHIKECGLPTKTINKIINNIMKLQDEVQDLITEHR